MCSVKNIDLCSADKKAELEEYMALDTEELTKLITAQEDELKQIEEEFKKLSKDSRSSTRLHQGQGGEDGQAQGRRSRFDEVRQGVAQGRLEGRARWRGAARRASRAPVPLSPAPVGP